MTDDLGDALKALLDRLLAPRLRDDPGLRAAVAAAGRAFAAWVEGCVPPESPVADAAEPPVAVPEPPVAHAPGSPSPVAPGPPAPEPDRVPVAVLASLLTLNGRPTPPPPPPEPADDRAIVPVELGLIARRCRLKAEAARLAAKHHAAPSAPPDPRDADLRRQAEALPDCHLWMLAPGDYVSAPRAWQDLAGGYQAAAEAADLLAVFRELPDPLADRHRRAVLYLAAEAQALLWAAVADVHRRADNDQVHLFVHVREMARAANQYIDRFLKREDRVAPETWPDLFRRLTETRAALGESRNLTKNRERALKNLKYKLRKMADEPAEAAGEWPRVLELMDEAVAGGVPPSHADLRDWLLPMLDTLPPDVTPGPNAQLVFRAADEDLATRPADPCPDAPADRPTAEVAAAAELLRGRTVVLIGGVERPHSRDALVRAFGLARLNWITTREHESISHFESAVADPDAALVLLAIRWSSHSYGDVQDFCGRYGKPLVRLPRGYNPNQVAVEILNQAAERLRAPAG